MRFPMQTMAEIEQSAREIVCSKNDAAGERIAAYSRAKMRPEFMDKLLIPSTIARLVAARFLRFRAGQNIDTQSGVVATARANGLLALISPHGAYRARLSAELLN